MKSRVLSFVLALTLIFTMLAALVPVRVNAATTSQQNIVNRANYLFNTTWVCQQTVKGWGATFYAGNTYRLPYGQPAYAGKYIGFGVSVDDFLAATSTAGSIFYAGRSHCGATTAPYYATDCSAFVSYCWGIARNTTRTIPNVSTYLGVANVSNVQKLQLGDALNSSSVGHVVLVTGLTYSGGQITQIEITEQTPPQLKRTYHTPSSLASKYGRYYSIYRYGGTVPASPGGSTSTTPQESPEQAQIRALLFDVDFYRLRYKDMSDAFGIDAGALKNHYDSYGLKEGRMGSVFFDPKFYLSKYSDLATAFGSTNYAAAADHFIKYGFKEGRAGSEFFCAKVYLQKNADIAKAFGSTNYLAAAQHYKDYGIKEMHRTASDDFSMQGYHDRYADIARAFDADGLQIIIHYITKGKAEGRDATPYYELPTISDVKVTDVTKEGYTLSCTVTSPHGVDRVLFPTWTKRNSQDDIVWHQAEKSGDTYSLRISVSKHNYEGGEYITHIYAYDKNNKVNKYSTGATLEAGMTIYDIAVTDVDLTGYTVTCKVLGGAGVSSVKFPTWTETNGQDDLVWHEGTRSGNTFTCRIDVKNHNKEGGKYITHIYAYDKDNNSIAKSIGGTDVGFEAPTISNVKVTDVTKEGFTITCTATSPYGIDYVSFPTWTERDGHDDIVWHRAEQDGNTFSLRISVSQHNYEGGKYHTTIHAYDSRGQITKVPVEVDLVDAMTIYDITISDVDLTGYTVSCKVLGGAGITSVKFPTWTEEGGQDDIIWHEATRSGNTYSYRVDIKDHNNEVGKYSTHIYAYDRAGNIASQKTKGADLNNQITMSDLMISDVDHTGYTISCKVTSVYGVDSVRFPTWTKYGEKDDIIWHEASKNGEVYSCRINVSDHHYEGGCYITHVYAIDETGSRYLAAAEANLSNEITIYNVQITNADETGYIISCQVNGGSGVDHVFFPTWTSYNGQDDVVWHPGTRNGNTFSLRVDTSEHNLESGRYITQIFAYDQTWNYASHTVELDVAGGANHLNGLAPLNLGSDFYAKIGTASDLELTLSGENVIAFNPAPSAAHIWHFLRQNDGCYKIINSKNELCLQSDFMTKAAQGLAGQSWFIYSVNGGVSLKPADSVDHVLCFDGKPGDIVTLQPFTGSSEQTLTIQETIQTPVSPAEQIRKVLFSSADYTLFKEAFRESRTQYAITIGAGNWNGLDAKRLLVRIRMTDPALFESLDTAGIGRDLDNANWSTYKLSKASAKAKCIQRIIGSDVGRACQDAMMDEQLLSYMMDAHAQGVTDTNARLLCAYYRFCFGSGALIRVLNKIPGSCTVEKIYQTIRSDFSNQQELTQVYRTLK